MTTSVSTRSTGGLNPTRQQLDELDALLQRMLDLPVHPLDEPEEALSEGEEPDHEPLPPVLNHDEPPVEEDLSIPPESAEELPAPIRNRGERTISLSWSSTPQQEDIGRSPQQPAARPEQPFMSYMVVETASPRPIPSASGFEPRQPASRLVPVMPPDDAPAVAPMKSENEELPTEEQPSPFSLLLPPFVPTADEPSGEEPEAAEMWVPLRSTWQPSPQTWPPLAESWHQAKGGTPTVAASEPAPSPRIELSLPAPPVKSEEPEVRQEEPPSPPIAPAQPRMSMSAEDAPASAPLVLLPLLWFNQRFDACFAPLGAPGRWICQHGRSFLGLLGLACLAAAIVIAVSARMAWTW